MKMWFLYILAGLCGLLGLVVIPENVREARRIHRLPRDGQPIAAEIIKIEEESGESDGVKYVNYTATVVYSMAGKQYQARTGVSGRSHRLGDKIPLLVLPDAPEHVYSPGGNTGNWIMTFMMPAILLLGAAVFGFAGWLHRDVSTPSVRP
jgi:hypothetical protein